MRTSIEPHDAAPGCDSESHGNVEHEVLLQTLMLINSE